MTDRFSNFADLAEHYAREVATPDYARAFMEQTEMAKLSIEHEPSSSEMPDPEVAQAAIEMMLATVFDLFRDTRMEDFASEVAWGIANSFHVVAKRLDEAAATLERLPWGAFTGTLLNSEFSQRISSAMLPR